MENKVDPFVSQFCFNFCLLFIHQIWDDFLEKGCTLIKQSPHWVECTAAECIHSMFYLFWFLLSKIIAAR